MYKHTSGYMRNTKTHDSIHREIMKPILLDALEELFPKEKWIVHHRDGDRSNNDIFNLEVMVFKKHNSIHKTGNKYRLGKWPYACYARKKQNPWTKTWRCKIRYNGKDKYLGYFNDFKSCEIVAKLVMEELNEK